MTNKRLIGGSFAPPLDEAKLSAYEQLAATAETRVSERMTELITMLRKFWETDESKAPATMTSQGFAMVPLEDAEVERIWDYVPYADECDLIGKVFDALPPGETRNAAYHLLWYARELAADREPMTADKIG